MPNPSALRHSCFALGLLIAAGVGAWADDVETVVIANQPIARIRERGPYANVSARAAAIDKAICEVISSQDTQHPKVAAKQSHGVWYVYSGPVQVMGVYAGDTKSNGGAVRDLAIQWADNIRKNLPLATPCSKLPASAFKLKPGQVAHPQFAKLPDTDPTATGTPAVAGTPATPNASVIQPIGTPAPAGTAATPADPAAGATTVADAGAAPTAATPPVTSTMPRNASLLLILDAFNVARNLSQEDYIAKRDEVAANLLANLASFMGDGSAAPVKPSGVIAPTPSPVSPSAVHVLTGTTGPTGSASNPKPLVANPNPKPVVTANVVTPKPPATGGMIAASDASGSKVAQKNRIKAKINSCQAPLEALQTSDPATAAQVTDLLKACRTAFAAKNYDPAEAFVDHAIQLMSNPSAPGAAPCPAPTPPQ